jgi:hypothetical protein
MPETLYSDYPDHPLRDVPQEVLDAAVRALDEYERGHGASGGSLTIEADDIEPVAHAVLISVLDALPGPDWEPGRWWRVITSDGSLWAETSSESEARAAVRPGDTLQQLWRTVSRNEWRDA